jgi:hypothetical protein
VSDCSLEHALSQALYHDSYRAYVPLVG